MGFVADSDLHSVAAAQRAEERFLALLNRGDIRSLDTELAGPQDRAAHLPTTDDDVAVDWFRCLRAILDGDAQAAEELAFSLFSRTQGESQAFALFTTHVGVICWMQGSIDDLEEHFLRARREYPEQLLWPASLAWLWLLQGRHSSAETLLRSLPDPGDIPRDKYWLCTMVVLAEIATLTGTAEQAAEIRDLLLPYAGRLVPAGGGVAFWGTAARTLGLLEERLGLLEDARSHLELALEITGRIEAIAWHAEAQIELAGFALRHDLADIDAEVLLAEARATCEARGFAGLLRRTMVRPRVRVLGKFEVVSLCGRRAQWSSRKARELLKMLVAARGAATSREVYMHALWPDEHPDTLGNRFAVAVNVVRRAFDPDRLMPTQHYLTTEGEALWLNLEHLWVDLERFFELSSSADADAQSAHSARALYHGDAFSDEPYADWAAMIRDRAALVYASLGKGDSPARLG